MVLLGKPVAKYSEILQMGGKRRSPNLVLVPSKRMVFKLSCKSSSAGIEHFQRTRSTAMNLSNLGAHLSLIKSLREAIVSSLSILTSNVSSSGFSESFSRGQTMHIRLNFTLDIAGCVGSSEVDERWQGSKLQVKK